MIPAVWTAAFLIEWHGAIVIRVGEVFSCGH
jgi:hypothetical protein